MTFHFPDQHQPFLLLTGVILLVVAGVALYFTVLRAEVSGARRAVRLSLNLLLLLVVVAYLLQPSWQKSNGKHPVLIRAPDVPSQVTRQIQDSLGIESLLTEDEWEESSDNPVTLIGQDFAPLFLSKVSLKAPVWIPFHPTDELYDLQWKAIVTRGEIQALKGKVRSSKRQWLRWRFAGNTLDSVQLKPGVNAFELHFPAFSHGRTSTELSLGDQAADSVAFFSQKLPPLHYRFQLLSPDFESKVLAEELGKSGNSVELVSLISKDRPGEFTVNRKKKETDILLTVPEKAGDPSVKTLIKQGKAVLFIGLTDPETNINDINRAVGTRFRLRKELVTQRGDSSRGEGVPQYSFAPSLLQNTIGKLPVAIDKSQGRVAVSLMGDVFPLRLSGDSTGYRRVWDQIFAELQPPVSNLMRIDAPVFAQTVSNLQWFNLPDNHAQRLLGKDTAYLRPSPVNPASASAPFRWPETGWNSVNDSLEVYVEGKGAHQATYQQRLVEAFVSERTETPAAQQPPAIPGSGRIPDSVWLGALLTCFALLWLEPKIGPQGAA